jgi:PAS domain S-box-containing protein
MTWWVGDTLGVLVALPLILVLVGQPHRLWRLRFWYVAIPVALCFTLFVGIFIPVRSWEQTQSLAEFQVRSQQLTDSMKAEFGEQTLFLEQLRAAFTNRTVAVGRGEFHGFVQALLQRFPTIQAVEWAPRVTLDERTAFESAQSAELPGFEIRERGVSKDIQRAGERREYYPVTYIEPLAGNESAAGFDLASDVSRHAAIAASIGSGDVVATAPIRLVQEHGEQAGLLLIDAVPRGPTGPGLVLVVLRMGSFASELATPLQSTLGIRLTDKEIQQILFDDLPANLPAFETTLDLGTRRYLIQTAPTGTYIAAHRGWQSWSVLAGGVLSTGLLGALLLLGTGYAYRIRAKEEELEAVIDRTPFMLTRCSRDLHYRFVSQSYAKMLGRRPEDIIGQPIIRIMGEEGLKTIIPHIEKALRGERAEYESDVHFRGVGKRMLRVVYTPDRTEQGDIEGWIASIVDVTEHRQTESQRDLLIAEVNHRVKNTLATVISIAHQSFKRQQPLDISIRSFDERIRALAQTHTRLAEVSWSGVALRTIIEDELAPYRTNDNVDIAGPDVRLSPKGALSLGMAFHELATNAAKYGALSNKGGSVEVAWEIDGAANEIHLAWTELGGPQVERPDRRGFGCVLLEKALPSDLDGTVKLDFRATGLKCLITFPLDRHAFAATEDPAKPGVLGNTTVPSALRTVTGAIPTGDRLDGARILVVEDETLIALELDDLFRSAGLSVVGPFGDVTQASQATQTEAIDIAVLDTNLNGELVYPVAEELLRCGIPFLFLTGYDASDLPDRYRTNPRVSKPFDHAHLLEEVRAVLVRNDGRDSQEKRDRKIAS